MKIFMGLLNLVLVGFWGWWTYAAYAGIYEPTKLSLLCVGLIATISALESAIRNLYEAT